jgi:FixJ family two-component response regulator
MIFDQLIKSVNQAIEKENVRKEKVQEKKVLKQTIKTLKSKGTK